MTETNILLETGTNELEVVAFEIAGNVYGINVAKVSKILQMEEQSPVPKANPSIEGLFQYMDKVVPLINLSTYLNLKQSDNPEADKIIVTEFNQVFTAFHVHEVSRIHRISWDDVETPDNDSVSYNDAVTGVIKFGEKIILLLDFEKIIYDISPHHATGESKNDRRLESNFRSDKKILIAEDSEMLRSIIRDTLTKAGYNNLIMYNNGLEALEHIAHIEDGNANKLEVPDLIITDIEMPKMDGHHFCKKTRETNKFADTPIIIFSSLINEAMYQKGLTVGASEQLSKPQILKLVHLLDDYLAE